MSAAQPLALWIPFVRILATLECQRDDAFGEHFMVRAGVRLIWFVLVFCAATPALANPVFDDLQWYNRVLVITGDDSNPAYIDQYALLEGAAKGLEQRDVIVLHYHGQVIENLRDLSPFPFETLILRNNSQIRYFEGKLQTDKDAFSVVLVGLDGETKQVWREEPVDPQAIFAVIDAMPFAEK